MSRDSGGWFSSVPLSPVRQHSHKDRFRKETALVLSPGKCCARVLQCWLTAVMAHRIKCLRASGRTLSLGSRDIVVLMCSLCSEMEAEVRRGLESTQETPLHTRRKVSAGV